MKCYQGGSKKNADPYKPSSSEDDSPRVNHWFDYTKEDIKEPFKTETGTEVTYSEFDPNEILKPTFNPL
ncbi:hypothetical protein N9K16_05480 [Alphaproteobacteria bacterium]|nr:hypothetical protein [Alphaproteobacteria bacterium]